MDVDNLGASVFIRDANLKFAVEATGAPQSGVDGVAAVGGADDDHIVAALHPIEQGQQLSHDPALHLAGDVLSLRGDAVELVDEDDGWGIGGGLVEYLPELLLALAVVLADDLRAVNRCEVGVGLGCDRLREQGLSSPRRAMQKHALRGVDAQSSEEDWVLQWQLNHLPDVPELVSQAAYVLVGDGLDLSRLLFVNWLLLDYNLSVGQDLNDAFRVGRNYCEWQGLGE